MAWTPDPPNPGDTNHVLRTPLPLAVLDPRTQQLTAANTAFTSLLGLDASNVAGLDLFSFVLENDRKLIECLLAGAASGQIYSAQGRGSWRRADGGTVHVIAWVHPLDGPQGDRRPESVLLGAVPADGSARRPVAVARVDSPPVTLGVIDHEWRLTEVSADATAVLGWQRDEYRGKSLQAAVHPGDVPALLLALGRSGVDRRSVATPLRMALGEGGWKAVGVSVTPLCDHVPARYAVAMWSLPDGEGQTFGEGGARLERHLWRIALEVQAAGIYATRTGDVWMEPALQELSTRQSEVLRRLLRGERVPVIARELSVSQSTVRNHLSTIYRRLGVHSQPELLARLME